MATGFFYKTSADVGAPALSNAAGTLIAVLDWALDVANPSSEWEKIFLGTNKAVYRAKTGERRYLRVDDTGAGGAAYVRGYETMSGIDTGTSPFPSLSQYSASSYYALKTIDSAVRNWRIVGDSRYFALMMQPGGEGWSILAFGEATAFDPLDTYVSMLYASSSPSDSYLTGGYVLGASLTANTGNRPLAFARSADGVNAARPGGLDFRAVSPGSAGIAAASQMVFLREAVHLYSDVAPSNQLTTLALRGSLPYVYSMAVAYDSIVTPEGVPINFGSSTYVPLRAYTNGFAPVALLRSSDDEPGRT